MNRAFRNTLLPVPDGWYNTYGGRIQVTLRRSDLACFLDNSRGNVTHPPVYRYLIYIFDDQVHQAN